MSKSPYDHYIPPIQRRRDDVLIVRSRSGLGKYVAYKLGLDSHQVRTSRGANVVNIYVVIKGELHEFKYRTYYVAFDDKELTHIIDFIKAYM